MSRLVGLLLAVVAAATSAYKLPQTQRMSRRTAAAAAAFVVGSPAYALKPCPSGANNCYSSASTSGKNKVETWTWPKSATRDEALKSLSSVIDSYPQEGQSGVDLGGWSFADDEFSSTGYARLEFKSVRWPASMPLPWPHRLLPRPACTKCHAVTHARAP